MVYRGYVKPAHQRRSCKEGADVNQQRAKANTMIIKCLSCAIEHRLLAGGGIGVTNGGRRFFFNKAPLGRKYGSNGATSNIDLLIKSL